MNGDEQQREFADRTILALSSIQPDTGASFHISDLGTVIYHDQLYDSLTSFECVLIVKARTRAEIDYALLSLTQCVDGMVGFWPEETATTTDAPQG